MSDQQAEIAFIHSEFVEIDKQIAEYTEELKTWPDENEIEFIVEQIGDLRVSRELYEQQLKQLEQQTAETSDV
jgi:ubiquinone biosynthesis protein UbiJ